MSDGYFVAFDYEMWVKNGTTSSTAPTSTSGMTQVIALTNASMSGTSDKTDAPLDYSTELGWKKPLITEIGWSVPAQMNLSLGSAAYRLIKEAWLNGAGGRALEIYRKSPVKDGSGDNAELHTGIAQIEGFDEDVQAGNVATVSFTFSGYGPLYWYPQGNPVATVTVTTAGASMTPGTYAGVALVPVSPAPGVGSGLGCIASITVAGGGTVEAAPTITNGGTNFKVGDTFTAAIADLGGGGTPPVFTVATVS